MDTYREMMTLRWHKRQKLAIMGGRWWNVVRGLWHWKPKESTIVWQKTLTYDSNVDDQMAEAPTFGMMISIVDGVITRWMIGLEDLEQIKPKIKNDGPFSVIWEPQKGKGA